jgi:hypothetical protein
MFHVKQEMPMTTVTPILDATQIKEVTELRARLTRGGLAPEAVQKAVEAYQAGDIYGLNFATVDGDTGPTLTVPIPEELLVKVFPQLAEKREGHEQHALWADFLSSEPHLEYEINRHRGDRKSLTIRWPGAKNEEGPEPSEPEASPSKDDEEPF